jgi:ferredoxin-NADP reductase
LIGGVYEFNEVMVGFSRTAGDLDLSDQNWFHLFAGKRHFCYADNRSQQCQSDIVLLYAVNVETDLMFLDVLGKAAGVRLVTVIGTHITDAVIAREVPDYASRLFYISGPNAMVSATRMLLRGMSVSRGRIMTDYFPGL